MTSSFMLQNVKKLLNNQMQGAGTVLATDYTYKISASGWGLGLCVQSEVLLLANDQWRAAWAGGLEAAVPGHNTGTVTQSLERAMACLSTFSPLTVACAVHTSPDVLDPKVRAGRQVRSGRDT